MTRLDIDPRFAAAHYQDGRDLHGDAQQPSVHSVAGDLHPSSTVRTGEEGWQLVPVEPTEEMVTAAMSMGDVEFYGDKAVREVVRKDYRAMLAAAPSLGAVSVPPEVAGQRQSQDHPESCGRDEAERAAFEAAYRKRFRVPNHAPLTFPDVADAWEWWQIVRASHRGSTQPAAVPAYRPMTTDEMAVLWDRAADKGDLGKAHRFARAIESAVLARVAAAPAAAPVAQPERPLEVFSHGPWTFEETGQSFTGAELDEAAFAVYRRAAAPAAVQPPAGQNCGNYACHAATRDGVLCADGECDIDAGVRAAVQPVAQQQPSVHQVAGSGLPSQAVRTGEQGWISVSDRMPEPGTECLVYGTHWLAPEPYVRIDCWREQREAPVGFSSVSVPVGFGWDDSELEDITHWMPLPPAPQLGAVSVPAETASGAKGSMNKNPAGITGGSSNE